jgi:sulfate transport system ATP-binding protein
MSIRLSGIAKRFGDFVAVDDVDVEIETGELVALLGPSGSGKTTLLRVIAGLETPDSGTVSFDGEDATTAHPRNRQVGFVFQHYALFGHMTIFENVAFGLRVRPRRERLSDRAIGKRVRELLGLVQLDGLADRFPDQLSGGQRQRIALARALAVEPRVLLLDEPFGALDARVRKELRRWLRLLHDEVHVTSVFVTHDQEEALEVADRIVVMNHGRIEQVGTPSDVYDHPATPFVHEFIGQVNQLSIGMGVPAAFVRPHEIAVSISPKADAIAARLLHMASVGPTSRLEFVRLDDQRSINVELPRDAFDRLALSVRDIAYLSPTRVRQFGTGSAHSVRRPVSDPQPA